MKKLKKGTMSQEAYDKACEKIDKTLLYDL